MNKLDFPFYGWILSFQKLQDKLFNGNCWFISVERVDRGGSFHLSRIQFFSAKKFPPKSPPSSIVFRKLDEIFLKNFALYVVGQNSCFIWYQPNGNFRWEFMILREFCESRIYITSAEIEWISKIPLRMRNMNPDINSIFSQDCKFRFNSILFQQQLRMDCALWALFYGNSTSSPCLSHGFMVYIYEFWRKFLQFNVFSYSTILY